MSYQVVVVDDESLAGEQWALVRDGKGDSFLFITQSAMTHHPERTLSRAWIAWEAQRTLVPV